MSEIPVYIISGCRTPIGSPGGSLSSIPVVKLGSIVMREVLDRALLEPENVSQVIMGQVFTGGQGPNPARLALIQAKIPYEVPAYTVNMLCGSGLKSVYLAYQAIRVGDATVVIAGGQENMSSTHHSCLIRPGVGLGNSTLSDNIYSDGLHDPLLNMHMGDTAEHLAQKYKIKREAQDEFAYQSQSKTKHAKNEGHFTDEIVPIDMKDSRGNIKFQINEDEYPRPNVTLEYLSKLKPCFKGGAERTVTPGNSSGINDGAAAVLLCSERYLGKLKVNPLAKIVAFAQHGLEPVEMGLGPIMAVKNVLRKAGWESSSVDLFEINEAFAVQAILVAKELNIPAEKLNISGGAIALGHPISCSGTRILVTLLFNLRRLKLKRGIAAVCIGGGMGIAIAVERPD